MKRRGGTSHKIIIKVIISEAFTAIEVDKIFSGYQQYQLVKNYQHSRDHLYDQTLMMGTEMVPEKSVIFTK
jgi:hypothetical protein